LPWEAVEEGSAEAPEVEGESEDSAEQAVRAAVRVRAAPTAVRRLRLRVRMGMILT
jgi:hypothetical protein